MFFPMWEWLQQFHRGVEKKTQELREEREKKQVWEWFQ